MAFEFSLPTAVTGALFSSVILAATLLYLWRISPRQRSLLFWALAFSAQSLRMLVQLAITAGGPAALWILADTLFAFAVLLIWLGTQALQGKPMRLRAIGGLLVLALVWNITVPADWAFYLRTFPLYGAACAVLLLTAAALFRLARHEPEVGHRTLGALIGLLGLHYLDYPFLRTVPGFAALGFGLAAALMLMIGIAMLIITQRRQHSELIRTTARLAEELTHRKETETRYQALVEELDEGIVVVASNGKVLTANPAAARILGVPLEELRDENFDRRPFRLQREDGRPLAPAEYPLTRSLHDGQPTPATTYRLQRPDGSAIWMSASTHPLINEGETAPYAVIAAFSDISERKAGERNLLASELRFRSIFEEVGNIAVQGYDVNGRVIYWNSTSERFYGYSRSEALGKSIADLVIAPADRADFLATLEISLRTGRASSPGEFLAQRKDGSRIAIYSTQVMIADLHGEPEFYCIDLDLSDLRELQRELQEASERFRALSESSDLGMVVTDEKANFVWCNQRYLALIDSTMEEVLDGRWIKHLHPDEQAAMRENWQRAVATQSGFVSEREVVNRDGSTQWGRVHIVPIRTQEGVFRGFVATVEDITALKRAEQALRLSEARFSGAFHASLDYITISYLDTGELIDVNEAFETTTGWPRDEAIGRTTLELGIWVNAEERKTAVDILQRDGVLREYPMHIVARNGDHVDALLNGSIIRVGNRPLLLGVVRDIRKQKAAEQVLRESEARLSRIVHYSPVALAITDVETGVLVDVNRAWQEFLGYRREQVIGRNSLEFGLWVEAADREALYRKVVECGGEMDRFEVRYRRADGEIVYGLISGRVFEIGGRNCYLWAVTDITLRHQIEERMATLNNELEARVEARTKELQQAHEELIRSEKLAALGSLVAGVAHELNTPIGNSVTVASTLHDKTVEFADEVGEGTLRRSSLNAYLESARTASDLLLRSLSQARALVASFKQVAVDQTSDQRRRFDLREVVGEVLTTLSPTLRKTPFKVTMEIPEGIVMDSFPGPLGQVVSNFVNNAVLHAFEGRDHGHVELRASLADNDEVMLSVSDDGIGISEENLRRIFDPFFTTKLGQGGSGLGLNIVYNIATRVLGGRVTVSSAVGNGATFTLRMPVSAPGSQD